MPTAAASASPAVIEHSVILHRTVCLYCRMLPFERLDQSRVMTPLMVTFFAYTFFAIEALGDEIEAASAPSPTTWRWTR